MPVFAAPTPMSVSDGLDLLGHGMWRELVEPGHAERVLHGHRGDRGHAVDPAGQERLEIGLRPRHRRRSPSRRWSGRSAGVVDHRASIRAGAGPTRASWASAGEPGPRDDRRGPTSRPASRSTTPRSPRSGWPAPSNSATRRRRSAAVEAAGWGPTGRPPRAVARRRPDAHQRCAPVAARPEPRSDVEPFYDAAVAAGGRSARTRRAGGRSSGAESSTRSSLDPDGNLSRPSQPSERQRFRRRRSARRAADGRRTGRSPRRQVVNRSVPRKFSSCACDRLPLDQQHVPAGRFDAVRHPHRQAARRAGEHIVGPAVGHLEVLFGTRA